MSAPPEEPELEDAVIIGTGNAMLAAVIVFTLFNLVGGIVSLILVLGWAC